MHCVVQATRRMPGPSTAEPVVNECRKPTSTLRTAARRSGSGTRLARSTRSSNGLLASRGVPAPAAGSLISSLSVECPVDHVHLLFARQPDEVHRVAGDPDGEVG